MTAALPLALFVGGLATGLHCAGMCGPISAGFSAAQRESAFARQVLFNAGRITSYALAGAFVGALGSAGAYAAAALPAQALLQPLAARVLPHGSYAAGLVWGWLPCGLLRARRAAGFALAGLGAWGVAHGAQQTILCL